MTAIVFIGPTLSVEEARRVLDATYLPPVSQGDVYRAAQHAPLAIGIVDGYFDRVPAVWHKEILWAMSQGIHVFGSASMGALRAAELTAFGMEGVGRVFEAYRDGALEDDDEVAVIHGPVDVRYAPQSEAMVNIRHTLARAVGEGVISPDARAELERLAKDLFYPDRSYERMLKLAWGRVPVEDLHALERWLPVGRVDRKRLDAVAMLQTMRERLDRPLPRKQVTFAFEHTVYWEEARRAAMQGRRRRESVVEGVQTSRILDELRLDGLYGLLWPAAVGRAVVIDEARRENMRVSPQMLRQTADDFRRERNLLTSEDVERWLEDNDMTDDRFQAYIEEEALVRSMEQQTYGDVTQYLLDHVRSNGDYARLAERACKKARYLETEGLQDAGLRDIDATEGEIVRWYFEERLGKPFQGNLGHYARSAGFRDERAFMRAVVREYLWVTRQ